MGDRGLQRIQRVGVASVVFTVGSVIWAMVASYWLIWLIAFSFACSAFVLLGEYRKARARPSEGSAGYEDGRL